MPNQNYSHMTLKLPVNNKYWDIIANCLDNQNRSPLELLEFMGKSGSLNSRENSLISLFPDLTTLIPEQPIPILPRAFTSILNSEFKVPLDKLEDMIVPEFYEYWNKSHQKRSTSLLSIHMPVNLDKKGSREEYVKRIVEIIEQAKERILIAEYAPDFALVTDHHDRIARGYNAVMKEVYEALELKLKNSDVEYIRIICVPSASRKKSRYHGILNCKRVTLDHIQRVQENPELSGQCSFYFGPMNRHSSLALIDDRFLIREHYFGMEKIKPETASFEEVQSSGEFWDVFENYERDLFKTIDNKDLQFNISSLKETFDESHNYFLKKISKSTLQSEVDMYTGKIERLQEVALKLGYRLDSAAVMTDAPVKRTTVNYHKK